MEKSDRQEPEPRSTDADEAAAADKAAAADRDASQTTEPDLTLQPGGALQGKLFRQLAARAEGSDKPADAAPNLDRFELEERLGRGGMGEVFAARDRELGRRVALKRARPRGAVHWSPQLQKRFRREAQILSRLDHPNICRIFDLYEHQDSLYLVLELVDGERIDIAARALKLKGKLLLAEALAEGIAHAHRQGILHRDLKPANILVTRDGQVKILDFGISRALTLSMTGEASEATQEVEGTDGTAHEAREDLDGRGSPHEPFESALTDTLTQDDVTLGTPAYMSPEQTRGESVGTAADLYALGLILRQIFSDSALETEAPSSEPNLRGPRALRQLIQDLLAEQPVDRPTAPQAWRRLQRIRTAPRRRMWSAAIAGLLSLAIAAGVKYTVDIERERQEALTSLRQAEEVTGFLISVFEVADPGTALGEDISARELLDRGSDRIATELATEPMARARIESALGSIYKNLGLFDQAAHHHQQSLDLLAEQLPSDDPRLARGLAQFSVVWLEQGRFDHLVEMTDQAIDAIDAADLRDEPELHADLLASQAIALRRSDQFSAAEVKIDHALALIEPLSSVAESQASFASIKGMILVNRELYDEAIPWLRQSLDIHLQTRPENHPDVALSHNNLALAYRGLDQLDKASEHFERAVEIEKQVLGTDHPSYATSLDNLALVRANQGDLAGAEALIRESISIFEKSFGEVHRGVQLAVGNLSILLRRQGRFEESRGLAQRALAIAEQLEGKGSPPTIYYLRALAQIEIETDNPSAAIPYLERTLPLLEAYPDSSPRVISRVAAALVESLLATGDQPAAEALCPRLRQLLFAHDPEPEHVESFTQTCTFGPG